MGGHQGSTTKLKKRERPTDLFCKGCLQQVILLEHVPVRPYFCEFCVKRYERPQVLIFDEMIEAKFERVKRKNINILKGDMRP